MPIDKRKSRQNIVKELIKTYKRTGKIGDTKPDDLKHAYKIATAISYDAKENTTDIIKIKNLIQEIKDISEMKIIGRGENVVAFKDKIYLFDYTEWDKTSSIFLKELAGYFPREFPENPEFDDFDEFIEYLEREVKLDYQILTGFVDENNKLYIYNSDTYDSHSNYSVLLNKVVKELSKYGVSYEEHDVLRQLKTPVRKEIPDVVYHGTGSAYIKDILKYGVKPVDFSNWSIKNEGLIFFSSKPKVAKFHANNIYYNLSKSDFPIIVEMTIPDPAKLVPDYDLFLEVTHGRSHFNLKKVYDMYIENPSIMYKTGNEKDARKVLSAMRDSGVYGYKGRIPAEFIKAIWIDDDDWKRYTPEEFKKEYYFLLR